MGRVEGGRGKGRRGGVERRLREGRELGGKRPLEWWWDRGCVEFVWGGREKAREDIRVVAGEWSRVSRTYL